MKPTIENLQKTFKFGFEAFEESRDEAQLAWDYFHNKQYTNDQLAILASRGQPAETFNVVKLFSRMMIGYYSTVNNTITVLPTQRQDIDIANVLNDTVVNILNDNNFITVGDKIKLSGLLTGIMCAFVDVINTGEKDKFGRSLRKVTLDYVPTSELVLDPLSEEDDYSDARFLHRFKWVTEESLVDLFGKEKINKLQPYDTSLNLISIENDFESKFNVRDIHFNNFLLVHTIIKDKNKTWSVFWSNNEILFKKEISFKEVDNPYRVQRIHTADRAEYYGVFREVLASQQAINQALTKIQLSVNTHKVFVEKQAVDNMAEFRKLFDRVNSVIPVRKLSGIKVENLSTEIQEQYTLIDRAFDRIQKVLGVNDSFLGLAFASDSGRKVKLQQNATILALRYLTGRIEQFYRFLGIDIVSLIKQFYTANQVLRITDEITGFRWIELNKPMEIPTGEIDQQGNPIVENVFEIVKDPENGKDEVDEKGNLVIAPIPESETEVSFAKVDIDVISTAFNDEDEKNQLMIETILSGNIGGALLQVNPAGFFKVASLSMRTLKTRYSPEISTILDNTAASLSQEQQVPQDEQGVQSQFGKNPKSAELKLPQNTNEGL